MKKNPENINICAEIWTLMNVRKKQCRKFGKKTDLEELLKTVTEENKKKRLLRNKTEFFKLVSCIKLPSFQVLVCPR